MLSMGISKATGWRPWLERAISLAPHTAMLAGSSLSDVVVLMGSVDVVFGAVDK